MIEKIMAEESLDRGQNEGTPLLARRSRRAFRRSIDRRPHYHPDGDRDRKHLGTVSPNCPSRKPPR